MDKLNKSLFQMICNAPINDFFDVTSTSQIMRRFNESYHSFGGDCINHMFRMIFGSMSDFLIKFSIFASVSGWMAAFLLVAFYQLLCNVANWRIVAKKVWSFMHYNVHKLNVSTYETYTGGPIISCFGKQNHFIEKKRHYMDLRD